MRRLSSEEQRAEDERHAAVYDKLVRTLSRNSLQGRSTAPRPVGQAGEAGSENGTAGSLSRSSSLAGQRGPMRSTSLAAAAQQLARLSSQGEVVSPQSASGAPSPVRLARMSSAGGVPSPPPLPRISSQAGTPDTSQPTSPAKAAADRQPFLPPSPFGGDLRLRHVQSMPPHPPGPPAADPPPQPFDAPAETRSAPHERELQAALGSGGAHMPAELDPYCSRFMSGLVGDQEEAG